VLTFMQFNDSWNTMGTKNSFVYWTTMFNLRPLRPEKTL
jgi:hypothetical protein